MSSKEVTALRKEGRLDEALRMARTEIERSPDDIWLLRAYAWVLFDLAKRLIISYEAGDLSASALSGQLTPLMREFGRIAGALRRDMVFSQMLRLAAKVDDAWDRFLPFARWAGVEDFDDTARTPFVTEEGKPLDSLETTFKRAICRRTAALAARPGADGDLLSWGKSIAARALEDAPDDQWFNYYQSKIHLASGEVDLAIERLLPALRRQGRAAWVWALLGQILEGERPDDALTCYAHATQVARQEKELAKVRVRLARLLAHAERYDEAAWQVREALRYREREGGRVKPELALLAESDWYRRSVTTGSHRTLSPAASGAAVLLRSLDRRPLTYLPGVVERVSADMTFSEIATSATHGVRLRHDKFPILAGHPAGTVVEIGRADPSGPPMDCRVVGQRSLPGLYECRSGRLIRREGQPFAFIGTGPDRVFVPPGMASAFAEGESTDLVCWAVRSLDNQGRPSWRAVTLLR